MRLGLSLASKTARKTESSSAEILISNGFSFLMLARHDRDCSDVKDVVVLASDKGEDDSTALHASFIRHAARRRRRQRP